MSATMWGVLGPGRIAHAFTRDLRLVPDAVLAAVGSRSAERSAAFAAEHGFAASYGSYDALLADPGVDVVYVASPHALHVEHVTAVLEAGKHVLCEKPLTLRATDAEALFALARSRGLLLMEAMWTACHPVVLAVREALLSGRFGTPRHLHAEMGFAADLPPEDRLLDPALGAGVLLDMGIYPLTLAHLLLGEADALSATADLTAAGVDQDVAVVGRYPGGALATMTASLTSWSSERAEVATDRGRLVVEDFFHPTLAVFTPEAGEPVRIGEDVAVIGGGMAHEAVEVQRCLGAGLLESPLVPHAQTLTIMRQMDALRAQVGVRYAGD